jgi:hypothetical protein
MSSFSSSRSTPVAALCRLERNAAFFIHMADVAGEKKTASLNPLEY